MCCQDVQLTAANDDNYFVFEDMIYQVMLAFSRDTEVTTLQTLPLSHTNTFLLLGRRDLLLRLGQPRQGRVEREECSRGQHGDLPTQWSHSLPWFLHVRRPHVLRQSRAGPALRHLQGSLPEVLVQTPPSVLPPPVYPQSLCSL